MQIICNIFYFNIIIIMVKYNLSALYNANKQMNRNIIKSLPECCNE